MVLVSTSSIARAFWTADEQDELSYFSVKKIDYNSVTIIQTLPAAVRPKRVSVKLICVMKSISIKWYTNAYPLFCGPNKALCVCV